MEEVKREQRPETSNKSAILSISKECNLVLDTLGK